MIDFSDSIFNHIKNLLEEEYPSCAVRAENDSKPASYPCCTVAETNNTSVALDSELVERHARVQYRFQIASNRRDGKRTEAKRILQVIDKWLIENNFRRTGKTETPDLYHASVYKLTAFYEVGLDDKGRTFKPT